MNTRRLVRYTIMPDFGSAYIWINGTDDDFLSGSAEDFGQWHGPTMSPGLERAFETWQAVFEHGRFDESPEGEEVNWPKFHAEGLALSKRLKAEVGDAVRVFYQRPCEDPDYREVQHREILRDGTTIHWPKVLRPRVIGNLSPPKMIVSGGQTGVDRAALDWAIGRSIPHAGWCPLGRRANDGVLPVQYQLLETPSRGYAERTRKNVEAATTTLVLIEGALVGGSLLTAKLAERLGARYGVFPIDSPHVSELPNGIAAWLEGEDCSRLNIAGPSEERCPGIHQRVVALLDRLLPG